MSSSRQFAIMYLHAGLKDYHVVCTNYLSHSAISSIDCGKGSMTNMKQTGGNSKLTIFSLA